MKRTEGDVARVRFGRSDFFLASHPDEIKRVLISHERDYVRDAYAYKSWRSTPRFVPPAGLLQPHSDPDVHLRARRALQPVFRRARVDAHWPALVEMALQGTAGWSDGAEIDVVSEASKIVLRLVTHVHFGGDLDVPIEELVTDLRLCAGATVDVSSGWHELSSRARLGRLRRVASARERTLATLGRRLEASRGREGDDLATVLVRLADAEGLSEHELLLEAYGHVVNSADTSVSTFAWAVHLLSDHPAALDRLRHELDAAVSADGPDHDAMPYTRAVIAETLRLYPSTWRIKRRALVDHELGGRSVRRGAHVWVSPPLVHRDERWWPEPHRFLPERWLSESRAVRVPLTYLPFGAGSRKCLGEQIAWRELTALLLAVLGRWELSRVSGAKVVPHAGPTLRPKGGVKVRLRRRQAAAL